MIAMFAREKLFYILQTQPGYQSIKVLKSWISSITCYRKGKTIREMQSKIFSKLFVQFVVIGIGSQFPDLHNMIMYK